MRSFFSFLLIVFLSIAALFCILPHAKEDKQKPADPSSQDRSFWVEFIDVGQGDAALIQCDGQYMMIDGGPSSASSVVYTVLKNAGIDHLDYMIATHPDADHIGGLSGALNYASVDICFSPVTEYETKTFASLVKYLDRQGAQLTVPTAGTSFRLGSATVELLGPVVQNSDINNNSIVTKITYGAHTFLFMGDAGFEEEDSLLAAYPDLKCDVLKAGHHGSNGSTGADFLQVAAPRYAILSVGADNAYGHPTQEVLDRLETTGATVYRTDRQGDILCESDGKTLTFTTEKGGSNRIAVPDVTKADSSKTRDRSIGGRSETQETTNEDDAPETTKPREHKPAETIEVPDRNLPGLHEGNPTVETQAGSSEMHTYVLNTNTKKFHYPDCSSVKSMKEKNRMDVTGSREEIIDQGYSPCGRCKP